MSQRPDEWMNEADRARHLSEWLGAIMCYALGDKKRGFGWYEQPSFRRRNVVLGWLLQVGGFAAFTAGLYLLRI